jgi:predicted RNase H-like nuclease (RuvC/YqgF family)
MDYTQIINLITSLGLPTAIAILLWNKQNKMDEEHKKNLILKDEQNRRDTQALIDQQDKVIQRQDKRIDSMELNSKEDKKMFQSAIDSFKNAVNSFETINTNFSNVQNKIDTIEKDVTEIKCKMEK